MISNIKNFFQHYLNETVEVDFVNFTTQRFTVELISYFKFETDQIIKSKDDEMPCSLAFLKKRQYKNASKLNDKNIA